MHDKVLPSLRSDLTITDKETTVMSHKETYNRIFTETFSISHDSLGPDLTYNSISEWDSIGHMALIAALEDELDIILETDDIIEFSSYIKGFEILNKYGVSFDN